MNLFRMIVAAGLAGVLSAAIADEGGPSAAAVPPPPQYSLILPYNLPHLMGIVNDKEKGGQLHLGEAQRQALDRLVQDVRAVLPLKLKEAQQLENAIGRAVLDGQTPGQLTVDLDRLQQLKRDAAEIHIGCVNRVRQVLSVEQYTQLIKLALAK